MLIGDPFCCTDRRNQQPSNLTTKDCHIHLNQDFSDSGCNWSTWQIGVWNRCGWQALWGDAVTIATTTTKPWRPTPLHPPTHPPTCPGYRQFLIYGRGRFCFRYSIYNLRLVWRSDDSSQNTSKPRTPWLTCCVWVPYHKFSHLHNGILVRIHFLHTSLVTCPTNWPREGNSMLANLNNADTFKSI